MTRLACLLLLFAFAASGAAAQPANPATVIAAPAVTADGCASKDPSEVVVCGRTQQPYRIDPSVLAADRAANAVPPKLPITGDVQAADCSGQNNCAGGSYVPLVGMALTALKAAELAADGDDWREAFRTRPDEYQAFSQSRAKKGHVSVGLTVGNQ